MENTKETTAYHGIDISKDTLWIARQVLPNPKDKNAWQIHQINNTEAAILAYLPTLEAKAHIVFEATGSYSCCLSYCLELLQIPFSILNPKQSSSFADVVKSISQDDARDAALLAYYGSSICPAPTVLCSEQMHHLRQKRKYLQDLQQQLQAINNRLHALGYDSRAAKVVVEDLQEMKQIYEQKIEKFRQEISTMTDQEMKEISKKLQTIKGIGPVVANGLVINTNGFKDFENAKQLAKFLGLIGKSKESGSSVHRKSGIIKTGQSSLRASLYMAASSARRFNIDCKAFYERLRQNGKCHKVAIIAVVHKLVRVAFAIIKNNTEFDPNLASAK
jgi:transposase